MGQLPPEYLLIVEVASSEGGTGPDREDNVLQGLLVVHQHILRMKGLQEAQVSSSLRRFVYRMSVFPGSSPCTGNPPAMIEKPMDSQELGEHGGGHLEGAVNHKVRSSSKGKEVVLGTKEEGSSEVGVYSGSQRSISSPLAVRR